MRLSDVVNKLHNDNGLAHSSTAEKSDLATLKERRNQINDLNAGLKNLLRCRLILK